jgi:hypothetical protein
MRKFLVKAAAVMAAAGLVLAACGDNPGNGDGDAKTLVITNLPADWTEVTAVLVTGESYDAAGYAAVSGNAATIELKNDDVAVQKLLNSNWTGTGDYYVYLWDSNVFESGGGGSPAAITRSAIPFNNAETPLSYTADFEDRRGAKVGQISGTVTLTDVPAGASVSISAWSNNGGLGTSSYPVDVSTGAWTIPLYTGDFDDDDPDSASGQQNIYFELHVRLDNSRYSTGGLNKTLDLTNKTNIQAGNIGTTSLKAVTLSGTITVTHNGQPAPYMAIRAYANGNYLSETGVISPGAGASWSLTIPAFDSPTDVVIDVSGSDSNDEQLFYKESVLTIPNVSGSNVSGLAINLGDVKTITMSGTITVTYNGQPAPYVEIRVSGNGIYGSTELASPGANTPWAITLPFFDSPTNLRITVYGRDSNWNQLFSWSDESMFDNDLGGVNLSPGNFTNSAPSAPSGLNAAVSGTSVNLTWNSVSGATYRVYRSTSSSGSGSLIGSPGGTSYTDSELSAGTYYYRVSAYGNGQESEKSSAVSATVSGGGDGDGDALAGAKGKLTLTGFNEFNGKYVYSALVTTSGKYLVGTNGVELSGSEYRISMVAISGGSAEVPLYTTNASGTTVADIYVPYEGSEGFSTVSILIVSDTDGKFTASDAASLATNYVGSISSNASNTSFTPATSNGNITISRSDVMTLEEITAAMSDGDYTIMQTVKYMLMTQ